MRYKVESKKDNLKGIAVELETGRFKIKMENDDEREVAASTFKRWYRVLEKLEEVVKERPHEEKPKKLRREIEEKERQEEKAIELDDTGFTEDMNTYTLRSMLNSHEDKSIVMQGRHKETGTGRKGSTVKLTDTFNFLGFKLVAVYSHVWSVEVKLYDTDSGNLIYISPTGAFKPLFDQLGFNKEQVAKARKEIRDQRKAWGE